MTMRRAASSLLTYRHRLLWAVVQPCDPCDDSSRCGCLCLPWPVHVCLSGSVTAVGSEARGQGSRVELRQVAPRARGRGGLHRKLEYIEWRAGSSALQHATGKGNRTPARHGTARGAAVPQTRSATALRAPVYGFRFNRLGHRCRSLYATLAHKGAGGGAGQTSISRRFFKTAATLGRSRLVTPVQLTLVRLSSHVHVRCRMWCDPGRDPALRLRCEPISIT